MPNYKIKIDYREFYDIALQPTEWFEQFGEVTRCPNGLNYIFQDNKKPRLMVAHLDSVADHNNKFFRVVSEIGDPIIVTPSLDDRIGVYLILKLFKDLWGDDYNILLTDGEETGQDTVYDFMKSDYAKEHSHFYNWIVEFDRVGGTDCALYDYRDAATDAIVSKYGWKPVDGSFTDIKAMQEFNCKGFNFCTGYQDYHTSNAWANLRHTATSVARFIRFWEDLKDIRLPHTPKYYSGHGYQNDIWSDELWNYRSTSSTSTSSSYKRGMRPSSSFHNPRFKDPKSIPLSANVSETDFSWIDSKHTIVIKQGHPIFIHPTTKQGASFCAVCGLPHWVEQLQFTPPDGIPVCPPCFIGYTDNSISALDLAWVKEGGFIVVDYSKKNQTQRIAPPDIDTNDIVICTICGQPEWKENVISFNTNGGDLNMCRQCEKDEEDLMNSGGEIQ